VALKASRRADVISAYYLQVTGRMSGRALWCSDVESVARPECVQREERGGRGDASFVNNTIKGGLTRQNNVPAPVSSGNTAESLQGQCVA
jgi:hypothetical protein